MFLHKTRKKDGRVYLAIMEARRDGKRTRQRTVESLGYLDDLERLYGDPIAHFKAVCDERNAAAKAERRAVPIEIHPAKKIDRRAAGRKNIGSAALLSVYGSLGVERAIRNNTRGSKATFDLNAVLRLLVCERILNPGSKIAAWSNRDGYFFRSEFEEQHVYRALSMLDPLRGKIVSAINRSVDRQGVRDATSVFYDVTNYYFECDPDEPAPQGRLQGAPAQPDRPDGPLAGRERRPHRLPALPGQRQRLRHHDGRAVRHEAGLQGGARRRRGRQGPQHLRQHRRLRGPRGRLRLLAVDPRHQVDGRACAIGSWPTRGTARRATASRSSRARTRRR